MTIVELLELCTVNKTLTPAKARAVANTLGHKTRLPRVGYSMQIGVIDCNATPGPLPSWFENNYATVHLHHDARGYWLSWHRGGNFDNTSNPIARQCNNDKCKRMFVKNTPQHAACSAACAVSEAFGYKRIKPTRNGRGEASAQQAIRDYA